jgi:hypothetical protein
LEAPKAYVRYTALFASALDRGKYITGCRLALFRFWGLEAMSDPASCGGTAIYTGAGLKSALPLPGSGLHGHD